MNRTAKFSIDLYEGVIEFVIKEMPGFVTTVSGADGRMIVAHTMYQGVPRNFGWAIQHPNDEYNFSVGAKRAVKRLLDSTEVGHTVRKMVWEKFLEVFPPTDKDLQKRQDCTWQMFLAP